MLRILFDSQGNNLAFTSGGILIRVTAGGDTPVGHWKSDTASNALSFDVNGTQGSVACCYSFTSPDNQLAIQLKKQDGSLTAPTLVSGVIQVDNPKQIRYTAIDDQGQPTNDAFSISTDSVAFDNNRLLINFSDGSAQTFLTGEGQSPIVAAHNAQSGAAAKDLLTFTVITTNHTMAGGTIKKTAVVKLQGSWDIQNGLVFQMSGGTGGAPLSVSFVGGFKGVSAGFMYTPAGGGQGAFVVSGQHIWNSGSASWDVVVGFSQKKFTANLTGAVVLNDGLTIAGKLNVNGSAGAHNFDLELKVKKTFNNAGMLLLTADISATPGGITYNIGAEGTFNFNGASLTFALKVASPTMPGANPTVTLALASTVNNHDLMIQLGLVLKGTGSSPSITFTFTLSMTFQNGHLVKGQPQPLGAGAMGAIGSARTSQ